MSQERQAIIGALRGILDRANDEDITKLDRALRAYEARFERSVKSMYRIPMLADLLEAMTDECGYRNTCRDCDGTGTVSEDAEDCPTCEGEGRIQ